MCRDVRRNDRRGERSTSPRGQSSEPSWRGPHCRDGRAITDGDFGLFRGELRPGTKVDAHFHRTFSETFYVLSGSIDVYDGSAWATSSAGDLVYVPRGGIHGVRVSDDARAEVLTLFTPGIPRERFVMDLLEISASGRRLTPEEWTEFYARHDQFMV